MPPLDDIAVIGAGRMGTAISRALRAAGVAVEGPLGRGEAPAARVVLLCVPDGEIDRAIPAGDHVVGHCSGASPLGRCQFSVHPLMTVPETGATFTGVPAAVAGDGVARQIAAALGMVPFAVAEADRAAYHAAACMASNFLVVLEDAAERVAGTAGVGRDKLVPLIRATVDNWERDGRAALTGPIARGDTATVERHRAALPADVLPLYDALAAAC